MGITKTGNFAVLTNYRETDTNDANHPVCGTKSRGGMVTAWLTSPDDESTEHFVQRMLGGEGVKGIGGFSLLCGKLRRRKDVRSEVEPLAIISNRCGSSSDVPWIAESRGEVYGLSNTLYSDPEVWPKIQMGKEKLLDAVEEATTKNMRENELVEKLYEVLDTDTLPEQEEGTDFEGFICELRKSIFIHSIGSAEIAASTPKADEIASATPTAPMSPSNHDRESEAALKGEETPSAQTGSGMTGIYGTQRQTVILVDWEGNVTYTERSLWDQEGNPIPRGTGDEKFEFKIEGWNGERKGNHVLPHAVL